MDAAAAKSGALAPTCSDAKAGVATKAATHAEMINRFILLLLQERASSGAPPAWIHHASKSEACQYDEARARPKRKGPRSFSIAAPKSCGTATRSWSG